MSASSRIASARPAEPIAGATWSTSPDPVDFRRLELINIYVQANFFVGELEGNKAAELPGYRGSRPVRRTWYVTARLNWSDVSVW